MSSNHDDENYYVVLGVPATADTATIKAAYRRLALSKHPDKNRGNPLATAEFQKVSVPLRFQVQHRSHTQ